MLSHLDLSEIRLRRLRVSHPRQTIDALHVRHAAVHLLLQLPDLRVQELVAVLGLIHGKGHCRFDICYVIINLLEHFWLRLVQTQGVLQLLQSRVDTVLLRIDFGDFPAILVQLCDDGPDQLANRPPSPRLQGEQVERVWRLVVLVSAVHGRLALLILEFASLGVSLHCECSLVADVADSHPSLNLRFLFVVVLV